MSVRRLAPDHVQPASFAFNPANENWIKGQLAKYPAGRQASAVIPLLWKAQEQAGGWVPRAAIEEVGRKLGMPYMRVLEIATFYTMFNLAPAGEFFIQLCGTTPCALRGAEAIKDVCRKVIGEQSTVTADGKFSWLEVECLGACCNAPMVQINNDYYEDLTPENFAALLDDLRNGRKVKIGPQVDRSCSEPLGGSSTLRDASLYDGSMTKSGWQKRITAQREEAAKAAAEAARAKAAAEASAAAPAPAAPVAAPAPVVTAKPAVARPAPTAGQPSQAVQDTPAAGGAAIKGSATPPVGKPAAARSSGDKSAGDTVAAEDARPELLATPRGGKGDDLSLIWGVGPKLEKMLNDMGVWHFDQIAGWTEANLAYVDGRLTGFKGRAARDEWISQARKLSTGWRPENAVGDKPVK